MTAVINKFPGYKFIDSGEDNKPHNIYKGEDIGFGGYVYAEPGIYENVAVLDIASQHPTSIELLNLFGPYTKNFSELKAARIAIKHKDFDAARKMLGGKLDPYLQDESQAEDLSYALKIVINIVFGLTSAKFDNPFRDIRNKNNIVALRGALFMVDLKLAVQEKGFQVVHIKTDSIKIPQATPEIIDFVAEFGRQYGYDFEHETTYDKFCLVNDAVYIAKEFRPGNHEYGDDRWVWTAVGAQFQHPYVYKTLFTGEKIVFDDYCETKNVAQGTMYLDFDMEDPPNTANLTHVGRTGSFVPVIDGGGALWRVKEDKFYHVAGTKGYFWVEREMAATRKKLDVDLVYFEHLVDAARKAIEEYGSYEEFVEVKNDN